MAEPNGDPNERRYLFDSNNVSTTGTTTGATMTTTTQYNNPFPPSGFPGDEVPTTTTTTATTNTEPTPLHTSAGAPAFFSRFRIFRDEDDITPDGEGLPDEKTMEDTILANEAYINSLNVEERQAKVREGIRTGSLLLLGLTAIGFLLIYLDFIMIPLTFSRGLVYVFQPFINFFVGKKPLPFCRKRLSLPRWFAVFCCVILIAVVFFLIGLMIEFSVRQVLLEKEHYLARFDELYANFLAFAESLGYTQENVEALFENLDVPSYIFDIIKEFLAELPNIFLILLFTLYMLLDYDEKAEKSKLRMQVDSQIRHYIIIKVAVSAFVGVAVGITFVILGAHLALFFGLMTFVLNFIPNIGAIVATFLPMPVVVFDPNMNWVKIVLALAIPFSIHMIVGNVVEPKVIGHSLEMPPVSVLVVLMFWESVWGILGALISVPLTVAITTYLQSMDHPMPRVLAGMLSGDFSWLESAMNEDKAETKRKHESGEDQQPSLHHF